MTDGVPGFEEYRFAQIDGKAPALDDLKKIRDSTVRAALVRKLKDAVEGKISLKSVRNQASRLKMLEIHAPNNAYVALVYPDSGLLAVFAVIRQPEASIIDSDYLKRLDVKVDRYLDTGRRYIREEIKEVKPPKKAATKASRSTKSPDKRSWVTPEMLRATAGLDLENEAITRLAAEETFLRMYVAARRGDGQYREAPRSSMEEQARAVAERERARNFDGTIRAEARGDAIQKAVQARCLEASPLKGTAAPIFEQVSAGYQTLVHLQKEASKANNDGMDFQI